MLFSKHVTRQKEQEVSVNAETFQSLLFLNTWGMHSFTFISIHCWEVHILGLVDARHMLYHWASHHLWPRDLFQKVIFALLLVNFLKIRNGKLKKKATEF